MTTVVYAEGNHLQLTAEQKDHLGIATARLQASQHIPLFNAPAKIVIPPNQECVVTAGQTGLVKQLHAAVGDKVRKGQVLATLVSPQLVSLQAEFLKLSSDHHLAQMNWQRDQKLAQDGIIPERRLQESQAVLSSKASAINEAKQLLVIAGMPEDAIAQLASKRRLSQELAIRSPLDGVVLEKMVTTGERLEALTPLFHVGQLQNLWLEIHVPQEKLAQLKIGDRVTIENTDIAARVGLIGQSVNSENQTVTVRATLQGVYPQLRVGQNVNVQMTQASQQRVFNVPNTAIAQSEGKNYVFVEAADGFDVTAIEIVGKHEQDTVISGGLTGSESIAVRGAAALKAHWLGIGGDE